MDNSDFITFDELFRRVDEGDTSCVLLNVLPRAAFEVGRIPSSLNLPLAELDTRVGELLPAREQETIVYCASLTCNMASQAALFLRYRGYTNVREYRGGMEEWSDRHGRIERDATPARPEESAPKPRPSLGAAFRWVAGQPLPILFGVWLGTCALFALLYWAVSGSLTSGGARLPRDLASLVTAFGFSIAAAMSSGYGDVVAGGWMRVAVLAETAAGILLFTALISKILNAQQEQVLAEVHRLTYENRLVRVRTNLHFLLAELAEISGECASPEVPARRLRARIESVAAIFAGEMEAVRDLVRHRATADDDVALDALFACLAAGLEELADLLTCLPATQQRSPALRRSLRTLSHLGTDLLRPTVKRSPALTLVRKMDRVDHVCRALSDDLRPGDIAPQFALPGSDGRQHRLADHAGKPVVLLWFPKAFTGG